MGRVSLFMTPQMKRGSVTVPGRTVERECCIIVLHYKLPGATPPARGNLHVFVARPSS